MASGASGLACRRVAIIYPVRFWLVGSVDPARAASPGLPLAGVPPELFDDVIPVDA